MTSHRTGERDEGWRKVEPCTVVKNERHFFNRIPKLSTALSMGVVVHGCVATR
jgi:hypothetical protein